jgi:hypothetical protein
MTSVTDSSGGAFDTWTQRKRQVEDTDNVSEIWTAYTTSGASSITITCTWGSAGSWAGGIMVYSFDGANQTLGAVGGSGSTSGAAQTTFSTTGTGSIVVGGGVGWNATTVSTSGMSEANTVLYQGADGTGNQIWTTRIDGTVNSGSHINGTNTTSFSHWDHAAIEVQPQ